MKNNINIGAGSDGAVLKKKPNQLFERFRKSNQSGASLGLGLAIVKKICEVNQLHVDYVFIKGIHRLIVKFPE